MSLVIGPTLEQIAESHAPGYWQEFRLLANELLSQRDRLAALELRDTPDEGTGVDWPATAAEWERIAGDRLREVDAEERNHHITIRRVRETAAERDTERERAGRLERALDEIAYGHGGRTATELRTIATAALALSASDTKEDAS